LGAEKYWRAVLEPFPWNIPFVEQGINYEGEFGPIFIRRAYFSEWEGLGK
jgi:hypothetical protein